MKTLLKYAGVLFFSSLCATFAQGQESAAQNRFDALVAAGILTAGDGAGLDEGMTRAEFARVAALIMSLSPDTSTAVVSPFSDISIPQWTAGVAGNSFSTGNGPATTVLPAPGASSIASPELLARVMVLGLGAQLPTGTQPQAPDTWAQDYVAAAILGEEALRQGLVNPADVSPQSAVTPQDLAGMLAANRADEHGGQSAGAPDGDVPPEPADGLERTDPLSNEVLIDRLVQESYELAAAGSMYPYFDAGYITTDFSGVQGQVGTYIGRADGSFESGAAIGGALTMSVDFASMASGGRVDATINFDHSMGFANFELYQAPGGNLYAETVDGTYGSGPNSQNINSGELAGKFYGPSAEEVGGTWGIDAGSHGAANGTFNGKR